MKKQNIAIAILASGSSKRFDGIKLLATIHNQSLLAHSVQTMQNLHCPLFVVLGAHREIISPTLHTNIIINGQHQTGIASSIVVATKELRTYDAILFSLADQPLISAWHYQKILDSYSERSCDIVATKYTKNKQEIIGNPALFSKNCYEDLLALKGDKGAKTIITSAQHKTHTIKCDEAKYDIDTKEDLALVRQKFSQPLR